MNRQEFNSLSKSEQEIAIKIFLDRARQHPEYIKAVAKIKKELGNYSMSDYVKVSRLTREDIRKAALACAPPWPFKSMKAYSINERRRKRGFALLAKSHDRFMKALANRKKETEK